MTGPEIRASLGSLAETIQREAFAEVQHDAAACHNELIAHAGAKALQRATDAQLERLGRLLK